MERTDNTDILSDRFNLVGCRVGDNDLAFGTPCQDAHNKRMCLTQRDCIEDEMDVIASGFLQLPDGVGVLALCRGGEGQSANLETGSRS